MADVYLFGHISTGVILRLRGRYPEPDGYGEIVETLENHCGEAAGSAIVLARLGVSTVLEGNWADAVWTDLPDLFTRRIRRSKTQKHILIAQARFRLERA